MCFHIVAVAITALVFARCDIVERNAVDECSVSESVVVMQKSDVVSLASAKHRVGRIG